MALQGQIPIEFGMVFPDVLSGSPDCRATWRLSTPEELLQQVSGVWCSLSSLIRSLVHADRPHVQHLSWQRRVVDHGSTRMLREDVQFVPVLTPTEPTARTRPVGSRWCGTSTGPAVTG